MRPPLPDLTALPKPVMSKTVTPVCPLFLEKIQLFAQTVGDRPALIYNGRMISFAHLMGAASHMAEKFKKSDLSTQDLVGVICRDKAKQVICNLGLLLCGVPIISVSKASFEIALRLGMTTLVSDAEVFLPSIKSIRCEDGDINQSAVVTGGSLPTSVSAHDKPAIVWFSSGSTGEPKALAYSLETLDKIILRTAISDLRLSKERVCFLLGIHSASGLIGIYSRLSEGLTIVLLEYETELLDAAELFNIDAVILSPFQLEKLLAQRRSSPRRYSKIPHIRAAGNNLSSALASDALSYLADKISLGYGATECGPIAAGLIDKNHYKGIFEGYVLPGIEIEIASDEGDETRGNILFKGDCVALEFRGLNHDYKFSEATQILLPDRGSIWGNRLCLEGRASHLLNIGGAKFSAPVIERELLGSGHVQEVAVISLLQTGAHVEELHIFVVPSQGSEQEQVIEWCLQRIPYSTKEKIHFMQALPLTETGKISLHELRKQVLAHPGV